MTGKQLIVLALLISANYIYFSFKHISQELSNNNHSDTLLLNSEKMSNKETTEILKQIQVKKENTPPINIEEKVIEVIEAIQATKKTPIQVKEMPVETQIIKQPIESKLNNNLESKIEAALKGISTSQSIDK